MPQVIVVSSTQTQIVNSLKSLLPNIVTRQSFPGKLMQPTTVCWLPDLHDHVDNQVQELVDMVDASPVKPLKIVMLSMVGTADDVTTEQLRNLYGKEAVNLQYAFLYAIKMVDELELPYTIVRTLPLIDNKQLTSRVLAEGQEIVGKQTKISDLTKVIVKAIQLNSYLNQSVAVVGIPSFKN